MTSVQYGSRAYYEERIAIAEAVHDHRQSYLEALDEASCHLHVAVDAYSELLGTYDDGTLATLAALASVVGRVASLGAASHARQKRSRATLEELQEKLSAMPVEAAGA